MYGFFRFQSVRGPVTISTDRFQQQREVFDLVFHWGLLGSSRAAYGNGSMCWGSRGGLDTWRCRLLSSSRAGRWTFAVDEMMKWFTVFNLPRYGHRRPGFNGILAYHVPCGVKVTLPRSTCPIPNPGHRETATVWWSKCGGHVLFHCCVLTVQCYHGNGTSQRYHKKAKWLQSCSFGFGCTASNVQPTWKG